MIVAPVYLRTDNMLCIPAFEQPLWILGCYLTAMTFGAFRNVYELTGDLHGMFGWKERVAIIADVYNRLPAEEKKRTVILAGWYGPAAAVDYFGGPYGNSDRDYTVGFHHQSDDVVHPNDLADSHFLHQSKSFQAAFAGEYPDRHPLKQLKAEHYRRALADQFDAIRVKADSLRFHRLGLQGVKKLVEHLQAELPVRGAHVSQSCLSYQHNDLSHASLLVGLLGPCLF
jgi:hypothetical protein